jgi:hypothetical protein
MKGKHLLTLLIFFIPLTTFADRYFCTIDETSAEDKSTFFCYDEKTQESFSESVEPIQQEEFVSHLKDAGVEFLDPLDFIGRVADPVLFATRHFGQAPEGCPTLQNVYYRANEFNNLSATSATIQRVRALASALHEAGVCDLPLPTGNFLNINVTNKDELIQHFLCISNSESVFGRDNIGMGGRGPWGIHPMHNQARGTRAFVDGRMTTLQRDGACYPSQAVVRNRSGEEIKDNARYRDANVIRDNASCAMTLYRQSHGNGIKGFRDWGTTSAWGSNRHCSATTRQRLNFPRHLGALACCTDACRRQHSN